MIYISLGTNIGNRLFHLQKAIQHLKEKVFSWLEESIVIETPALLKPNSPNEWDKPYLNMIVRGKTHLSAPALLSTLQTIEQMMGRPADHKKWAPRIMDLDILLYDQEVIQTPKLNIPHPEILNRPFWLHLMAMLGPEAVLPNFPSTTLGELAHRTLPSSPVFTQSFVLNPQLVGVVNITPDSFSDGGLYFRPEAAIEQILKLHQDGATVIEIGAQSTRPGAPVISPEEEYERLLPVLEGIKPSLQTQEILLSLDSYSPATILKTIKQFPIAWINDVQGNLSADVLSEIADHNCRFVAMHSLGIPPGKENILLNLNQIDEWAKQTIKKLKACGFSESHIILDPGIGFGKSAYQNLWLLEQVQHLKTFQCPILMGHSRKSYIQAFSNSKVQDRDLETIAISDSLHSAGADYLRVHNIAAHQRFWVAKKSIKSL